MHAHRLRPILPVLAMLFGLPLGAQSIHLSPGPRDAVGILLLRPDLRGTGVDFPSFAGYLSGRIAVSGRMRLLLEFPVSNLVDPSTSEFGVGNPFLGVEVGPPGGPLLVQFGVRPPLAPDNSPITFWGYLSDITQFEAFVPNVLTFAGQVFYQRRADDGFVFEVGGGPYLLAPTDGGDAAALLHYGVRAGYEAGRVRALGGFSGTVTLTEAMGVGERTIDQFVATLRVRTGTLMPLGWVGLPLDNDYNASVGVVFGVGIEFPVGASP